MKTSRGLISVIFLLYSFLGSAQEWCGFDRLDTINNPSHHHGFEEELKVFLERKSLTRSTEEIYSIPVVVHVLHANDTEEIGVGDNISVAQVESAIEVLNDYFRRDHEDTVNTPDRFKDVAADVGIEFCLASQDPDGNTTTGITRHQTTTSSWALTSANEERIKSYDYWPSESYMNVWVVRLSDNYLGLSYFPDGATGVEGLSDQNRPDLDGIIMSPIAFGNNVGVASGVFNPYRFGKTLVHEVGHWLGLLHTFNTSGNSCSYTDYCEDTPSQVESSLTVRNCDEEIVGQCGEVVMHQNYMDYTRDVCMNLFTLDQKERMRAVMELSPRRYNLRFSQGCCGSGLSLSVPSNIDFTDETELLANWGLESSNDEEVQWSIEDESLVLSSDLEGTDSAMVVSGSVNYLQTDDLFLRFNVSSNETDSVKVYYEYGCSGALTLLSTIETTTEFTDVKISLKGLESDGLMNFFIVVYNNGNEVKIDDLQIYRDDSEFSFTIYPNPISDASVLSFVIAGDQEVGYELYDVQGKIVHSKGFGIVNSGEIELSFPRLVAGIYVVKVIAGEETGVIRILVN